MEDQPTISSAPLEEAAPDARAQLRVSELAPIRYLIDTSPISYHTPADAGC